MQRTSHTIRHRVDKVATGGYNCTMKSVGIKVLKNKLSEYVRLAAQGEVILICDHDNVVAELRAVDATRAPVLADSLLADAIRTGLVTLALIASGRPPACPRVTSLRALMSDLSNDRSER